MTDGLHMLGAFNAASVDWGGLLSTTGQLASGIQRSVAQSRGQPVPGVPYGAVPGALPGAPGVPASSSLQSTPSHSLPPSASSPSPSPPPPPSPPKRSWVLPAVVGAALATLVALLIFRRRA